MSDEFEGAAEDPLTSTFNRAADHLKSLVSTVDNQTLLTLYSYYKQGSEGSCNTPKPGWYDVRAKAKWEAWRSLGDMPKEEAQTLYIEKIRQIDPDFSPAESKDFWVRVSTLQNAYGSRADKTIVDHIRGNDVARVRAHLAPLTAEELNRVDGEGLSLLHYAADIGLADVLTAVLEAGVDVDLRDKEGQTALHYAASCGHAECVALLLAHAADPHVVDLDGKTPISVAYDEHVKSLLTNLHG